ncbi:MAG: HNH endonuclease [Gallionella sp.]|nr:HNH endonuclease [Gallionella sp.]
MKTPPAQIVDYWCETESECGLSVDWAEAHERCWRCGYKSALERCHIVPSSRGGSEEPSNLVLLCGRCHREAPNVTDSKFMWLWLRAHATPFYDTYWTERGLKEFEVIFKRKPFSALANDAQSKERIESAMWKYMQETIVHFGEGRLNPSTIAWVMRKVEDELANVVV